jgi:hypothetical protein
VALLAIFNDPEPLIKPLNVSIEAAVLTLIVEVVALVNVKFRLVDPVAPEYINVPPLKTISPPAPAFPLAPDAPMFATETVPADTVTPPVKVLALAKIIVPGPIFVKEPDPEKTPVKVHAVVDVMTSKLEFLALANIIGLSVVPVTLE